MAKNWRKTSLTWGKRVLVAALVMAGVGYGALSLAQRSTDAIRKGLEDYITKGSGHRGEITDLAEARFVPDVRFAIKGVYVRDAMNSDKVYLHADALNMATPFWRMMFGSPYYNTLEVKGLEIATGFFLPKKLDIAFGGITDPDPQNAPAQFVIDGQYNALPLLATVEMDRKITRRGPLYGIPSPSLATFKLGDTDAEGIIVRHFISVSLESVTLKRGDMVAEFTAHNIHERPLNADIKGSVNGVEFNALLTQDGETVVLKITPVSNEQRAVEAIKRFTDAVAKDLGLAGENGKVRIEITGDTANTDNTHETPKDSDTP